MSRGVAFPVTASLQAGLSRIADVVPGAIAQHMSTDSLAARLLRPLVNRLVPEALTVVTVRSGRNQGARIPIYPRLEKYYWTGTYEEEIQELIWSALSPGDVFWDIGAHIGFFSLLASRRVGSSGHVVAVEPYEANRRRLTSLQQLNDLRNIEVLSVAVHEHAGTGRFVPMPSSSMGWVKADGERDGGIDVHVASLDSLLETHPAPRMVKIDVEGSELDVLRGAVGLARDEAVAFIVEFDDPGDVEEARRLMPGHVCSALSDRHWLLQRLPGKSTSSISARGS